jgi:hypothetical protein
MLKKPQNVYLPIDKFQAKVFKQDEDKRGEWVTNFALALAEEAEDGFAKELLRKAQADLYKDILRGWRFNARRALEAAGCQNPTDFQVHEKCIEDFGDEYLEAIELLASTSKRIRNSLEKKFNRDFTADGDIREDSQAIPNGSAITRNETRANDALEPSATISAVAPTREDGEDCKSGTTATIYGDAESGNASEATTTISDLSGARESRRTDGHSLRVGNVARPPVRSPGRKFRNKEDFIQWAIDTGLDPDDAGNCWEATMERGGLTKDGKKVDNLCAYTVKWCRTSKKNRKTA